LGVRSWGCESSSPSANYTARPVLRQRQGMVVRLNLGSLEY
jgi:hypothetical protein